MYSWHHFIDSVLFTWNIFIYALFKGNCKSLKLLFVKCPGLITILCWYMLFAFISWMTMYLYLYLFVFILVCIYTCLYLYLFVFILACIYTCLYLYLFVFIPACIYTCLYLYLFVFRAIPACIYTCLFLFVFIPVCIYTCLYVYLFVFMPFIWRRISHVPISWLWPDWYLLSPMLCVPHIITDMQRHTTVYHGNVFHAVIIIMQAQPPIIDWLSHSSV